MRVTTADLWTPAPGRLLCWDVTAGDPGRPAPLSLNQRNHLAGADAGEATVWLAAAFDVDGPIEVTALERAFQALVARHSSLQIGVARPAAGSGEGPVATRHDPGSLRWLVREAAHPETEPEMRAAVAETLGRACQPYGYAAFAPLAISRRHRSTVIFGMDHLHCDAYSTAVVVDELSRLYDASRTGADQPALPEAGCFASSVATEADDPVVVWHDDQRLQEWHAFARERDFTLPTFPLGLGVEPGAREAQCSVVAAVADAATTAHISAAARAAHASTYAAVLAALAAAVRDLGGPSRLDTLVPMQTRSAQAAQSSVGWYTTTVPVSIHADTTPAGLALAGAAVRRGVRLGAVPLDQVMGSLPEPLRPLRRDVFMVSWLDYRHLPGAEQAAARNAHHISAATLADDLQLWVSRTDDGLAVRVRHPATDTAREVVAMLLEGWRGRLREVGNSLAPPSVLADSSRFN